MGMETTIKSAIFIALFTIAITAFAVNFAIDNDSDIGLGDDSRFTDLSTNLQSNDLEDLKADSKSSQDILLKTSLSAGDAEISGSGGQFKVGPYSAMKMTVRSLKTSFDSIFGPEFKFILTAFVSLMTFLVGYYVVKAWLGRDPN